MKSIIHPADTRGDANHGWLHSRHTFSFANYFNPNRMQFGALRVLNDDKVAPGKGFGMHPHQNMEIISIPLEGDLEHRDSMGNSGVIKHGDVQVMSAGTGVQHSEYNKSKTNRVKFLQIWVLPHTRDVKPRYDQITLQPKDRQNTFQQILSPNQNDEGVWIYQNAWFHLADFEKNTTQTYSFKAKRNGLYIFVLNGNLKVGDQELHTRDGYGIWETDQIDFQAIENSSFLLD